jgi:hypothetical protein
MKASYGLKLVLFAVLILIATSAQAQKDAAVPAAKQACGPENAHFDVTLDASHPLTAPASGKAVVYVLNDFPEDRPFPHFALAVGMDGQWIGANQNRSYFGFLVAPGTHHLCADGPRGKLWPRPSIELRRFEAKAGETYYFRIQFLFVGEGAQVILELQPVDEDEGQFLIQTSRHSASHIK